MNEEALKKSLMIMQRMLERGNMKDNMDDYNWYEKGYSDCLKDIAYIIYNTDEWYWLE